MNQNEILKIDCDEVAISLTIGSHTCTPIVNVGDHVKVSLNYRAREFDGRRFNSIWAWRIEWTAGASSNGGDDLPF